MHPTSRLTPFAALALSRDGGAVSGFLANITVAAAPEADMPSDDVLKVQISSIGGKVEELEHITTDAGDTVRVGYTLELQAGLVVEG